MSDSTEKRILFTRLIPSGSDKRFADAGCKLDVPNSGVDEPMARDEFLRRIGGCHGVVSMLTDKWDAEAFDAAGPQLRIVANFAVGYNNIDLAEAERRGVLVSNTPEVLTEATADIAWALMMMAGRRLGEAERDVRAGRFGGWGPNDYLGVDLVGKTLGIIGAGRIGTATARRSLGWKMRILYMHPRENEELQNDLGAEHVDLKTILKQSDYLSIHVPLTPETRHLIGVNELSIMKPSSVLVNTARGPVIDEAALVEALKERWIFAAGLDVYEDEPALAPGLADLENVVLLPHLGSATAEARTRMAKIVADNILAAMEGTPPPNLVKQKPTQ